MEEIRQMRKFKIRDKVTCGSLRPKTDSNLVVLGYCKKDDTEYILLGNVNSGHGANGTSSYYDHNGKEIGDVRDNSGHFYAIETNLRLVSENVYDRPLEPKDCYKVKETPKIKLLTNKNNIIKIDQNF